MEEEETVFDFGIEASPAGGLNRSRSEAIELEWLRDGASSGEALSVRVCSPLKRQPPQRMPVMPAGAHPIGRRTPLDPGCAHDVRQRQRHDRARHNVSTDNQRWDISLAVASKGRFSKYQFPPRRLSILPQCLPTVRHKGLKPRNHTLAVVA
jgi:hypothetical protein